MARRLRPLTEADLNPVLLKRRPAWSRAMLQAANLMNEMYAPATNHLYAIGDCLLGKLNLLARRVRRNPGMMTADEAQSHQRRQAARLRRD